jgi:NitT/TauT family transport system ATP-binding protein
MIKFNNVTKSFNGQPILDSISFAIQKDETVGLLGPSGSGKTTMLRLITGGLAPDAGSVEVNSRRIGYIFQDHRLLPWRTAADNIALVLQAQGKDKQASRETARAWMDRLGLKGFYNYYPAQLSGGMTQRVSICRAFAIEPEIMLMDEPFSSLDAGLAETLLDMLEKVLESYQTTVVYVTHDLLEAVRLCDRIFNLDQGHIREIALSDREAVVKNYCTERLKNILKKK